MYNSIINRAKCRVESDRADSGTVSQILWIALTVVLVIGVATIIGKAVADKGKQVGDTITESDTDFAKSTGLPNPTKPVKTTP